MFSLFARGRKAPLPPLSSVPEGPIRVDEARLAALALALGDIRPSTDPPYPTLRRHRGMLPDVDWSNAVPMPARRSLLRLIAGALATRMLPMASLGDAASRAISAPDAARRPADPPQAVRRSFARSAIAGLVSRPTRRAA